MKIRALACTLAFFGTALGAAEPSLSQPNTSRGIDINKLLDVSALKLEMAENNVRLRPSFKYISELVSALEETVNTACLKDLHRTLRYEGKPTNPICVEHMERLLQLNPDNPAALCLRDGIDAATCVEAYKGQLLIGWSSGSNIEMPDPALKVGMLRQEFERLTKAKELLPPMLTALSAAQDDTARWAVLDELLPVYDTMLGIACRVVVLRLREKKNPDISSQQPQYLEVKDKLSRIPSALREEYQENIIQEYEAKLAEAKADKDKELYRAIIILARDPDAVAPISAANAERVRFVLPECVGIIADTSIIAPSFPSPICHREGWYTPQCITAIKSWYRLKQQRTETKPGAKGTPGSKKNPMISEF